MKWNKEKINADLVREFSSRFEIDLLTAAILVRRGLKNYEDAIYYLEDDTRFLHNPFLFNEMEDAVDRLREAIEEGERILIFGDKDVDGITSTVLLFKELTKHGLNVSWILPKGDDPYGLTMEAVDKCAANDITMIITVDCGISNHNEIDYARSKGIDAIVVDHHNPHDSIPDAVAIINPKVEDSGYPFDGLAGCAVAAKVIWALRFSFTPLYNHQICLLNFRPGNETVVVEAVKLLNFVEVDRIIENLVPEMVSLDQTRLPSFLANQEIYIYDEALQKRMLQQLFGNEVEVGFIDAAPEIWKIFPSLQNKSLFRMLELSRLARYNQGTQFEIDVFINIFKGYVITAEPSLSKEYNDIMDLVALGTIADLMPMVNENRILVRQGMILLNKGERPGIYELMFKQNILAKNLVTKDIAWNLSPIINAAGRMGVPERALELFLSEDSGERRELAEEIIDLNKQRKALGEKVWKSTLDQAQKSFQDLYERMVIVSGKDIHRGITGIIAARLVNAFNVTALVISEQKETAVGSVRGSGSINVKDLLSRFSNLFIDFGGHDYAAGFSIKLSKLETLRGCLKKAASDMEAVDREGELLNIDAELPEKYMNPDLIKIVEKLEPYGEGNQPLVFLIRGVTISGISIVGKTEKQHIKMTVEAGENNWPAIFWNAAERAGRDFSKGDKVDLLFRLGRNYFQSMEHLQLTVLDVVK